MNNQDKQRLTSRLEEAKVELTKINDTLSKLTAAHGGKPREPSSLSAYRKSRHTLEDEIQDLGEAISFCDGQITEAEYRQRFGRIYGELEKQREIEGDFFSRVEDVTNVMAEFEAVTQKLKAAADRLSEAINPLPALQGIFRNLADEGLNFEKFFHNGEVVEDTTGNETFIDMTEKMFSISAPRLSLDPGNVTKQIFLRLSLLGGQARQLKDFIPKGPIKASGRMATTLKSNQPTRSPIKPRKLNFNRPSPKPFPEPARGKSNESTTDRRRLIGYKYRRAD